MRALSTSAATINRIAALLLLAEMAQPALAAKRITVKQLDQALANANEKPDQVVARWLAGLELIERMSTQDLLYWKEAMPGIASSRALTALADSSAFLNPPVEKMPKTVPPDHDAQQKLLALASAYVDDTHSKLPNFFATQGITTFQDTPSDREGQQVIAYQPLHYADFKTANVLYRGGKEVMETRSGELTEKDETISPTSGLLSSGEFGPVLKTVLADAQKGKLAWSHWESGIDAPIAVFRYSVPRKNSQYKVKVLLPGHSYPAQSRPAYHGEIAVDSLSGTILRITLLADLIDDDPMSKADLMVEYGPVEIGKRSYICPIRSTAIVIAYRESRTVGVDSRRFDEGRKGPQQTLLNDVTFGHYQVLRSEARVLTGADTDDDGKQP
jgi:hypothetical protein